MFATNDGSALFPHTFLKFDIFFNFRYFACIKKKNLNNLVIYSQKKIKLHNFKTIFTVVLRAFDLESYGQTSLKTVFVMFGLVFMKPKKLKGLHKEKNLISIKLTYFHYLSYFSLYEVKIIFKLLFPIFD